MDQKIVHNIMGFMLRVKLTGKEVPAFNEAMMALQAEFEKLEPQPGNTKEILNPN